MESLDDYWADALSSRPARWCQPRPVRVGSNSSNHSEEIDDYWADPPLDSTRKRRAHVLYPEAQLAQGISTFADPALDSTRKRRANVLYPEAQLAQNISTSAGCSGGWCAPPTEDDESSCVDDGQWRISSTDHDDILRWLECARIGRPIAGTRLVPCKTPFEGPMAEAAKREELVGEDERFEKQDLLQRCQEMGTPVGLVVDLVNTSKYYKGFTKDEGVEYKKLWIAGQKVPDLWLLREAFDAIDNFKDRQPTKYVAVHCTHGVNRTGFFIATYLLVRGLYRFAPDAIAAFEAARGEKIDKLMFIRALHRLEVKGWY